MRKILYAFLLSMLLWGCSSTTKYLATSPRATNLNNIIQTWIGQDVNDLIQQTGPPTNVYTLPNGSTMYTWRWEGGTVAMPLGNMAYAVKRYCENTFTVNRQGIIQSGRWKGNC